MSVPNLPTSMLVGSSILGLHAKPSRARPALKRLQTNSRRCLRQRNGFLFDSALSVAKKCHSPSDPFSQAMHKLYPFNCLQKGKTPRAQGLSKVWPDQNSMARSEISGFWTVRNCFVLLSTSPPGYVSVSNSHQVCCSRADNDVQRYVAQSGF